jgi:hypothetical protein
MVLCVAWLLGSLATYFVLGFQKNFYSAGWQLGLWGLAIELMPGLAIYYAILGLKPRFILRRKWPVLLTVSLAFLFCLSVIYLVNQFPRWYHRDFFLLPRVDLPWFISVVLVSLPLILGTVAFLHARGVQQRILASSWFQAFLRDMPGLALALAFFLAYFSLAFAYSPLWLDTSRNLGDNFYDADPADWMNRLAAPASSLIMMRPVHPFAFLVFRPLTWLVALLLNGNKFYAAILLNCMAGALCVFLAWLFVRRWSSSRYAALISTLLGVTASHLVFSTFLETYIFSAAALIAFLLLVWNTNRPLGWLIPSGLLVFGITITNFIQTVILFIASDFKAARIAKYVSVVLVLALVLAWLQAVIYPTSQPFYDPARMQGEQHFATRIYTPARLVDRAYVVARTILLYSTVAPRPLVFLEQVGCEFPCFQTYERMRGQLLVTSYAGLGSWLARSWFVTLLLAAALFARKLWKSPPEAWLQLGLLACILFNFVLHVVYGDDPMLYSPDWTYALIFFTALSLKQFGAKLWFQLAGFAFLAGLMLNNWQFLHSMLVAVEPFL